MTKQTTSSKDGSKDKPAPKPEKPFQYSDWASL